MKGQNVSEMRREKKMKAPQKKKKPLRGFEVSRLALAKGRWVRRCCQNLEPQRVTFKKRERKNVFPLYQLMMATLLATCLRVHVKSLPRCGARRCANGSEKRVNHCCAVSHMLTSSSMVGVFQGLAKHRRNTSSLFMRLGPARERGGPTDDAKKTVMTAIHRNPIMQKGV